MHRCRGGEEVNAVIGESHGSNRRSEGDPASAPSVMRVAYITSFCPWSGREAFVLDEIVEHIRAGWRVFTFPVHNASDVVHAKAQIALQDARQFSWMSLSVLRDVAWMGLRAPHKILMTLFRVVVHSWRNPMAMMVNLAVFPKAVSVAREVIQSEIRHVHAHWLSSPTTVAYIVNGLTDVPFSFTSHAWDIYVARNMVPEKIRRSATPITTTWFNKREIEKLWPEVPEDTVVVLNTGIEITDDVSEPYIERKLTTGQFNVTCVANLVEKKGHRYLLEALRILNNRGYNVALTLIGDGPLRGALAEQAVGLGIGDRVEFRGSQPHEEVLRHLQSTETDLFALASVVLPDGQCEGLPFALMEAMVCGIPTIATDTVGVSELLGGGAGVLVDPEDPVGLADAIQRLIENSELCAEIGREGQTRVRAEFNLAVNAARLRGMISEACASHEPHVSGSQ